MATIKAKTQTETVLELVEPSGYIFPVHAFGSLMDAETVLASAIRGGSQPFVKVYETPDREGKYTKYNAFWVKGYKPVTKPVPDAIQKLHDEATELIRKGAERTEEDDARISELNRDINAYYER